jgi:hypothetical protein
MLGLMKIFSHHGYAPLGGATGGYCDAEHRRRELSRLLPLWPAEIDDSSLDGRRRLIATMQRALRAERVRGQAGHWAYDLSRHAALHRAWRIECDALRKHRNSPRLTKPRL